VRLAQFELVAPRTMRAACRLLEKQGGAAEIIAGGTDLLVAMKNRLKNPGLLVDLRRIPHLDEILYSPRKGLRIGAMVTLRQLAASALVRALYPILAQAAAEVGSAQLQAMGTVGGNLCQDTCCMYFNRSPMLRAPLAPCHKLGGSVCHVVSGSKSCWATYCGDLAPALLALGAEVSVVSPAGTETMPLGQLFSGEGSRPQTLRPGQVVSGVSLSPLVRNSGGAYLKLRLRKTIDYPLLGVAATIRLQDGVCQQARVALTAVDKGPLLVREAESLVGGSVTGEALQSLAQAAYGHAHPVNNASELPPSYRREMVRVFVRRAMEQALRAADNPGGAM
jgi:4-hydroxybenzoyl-CoA reductase subunit beta